MIKSGMKAKLVLMTFFLMLIAGFPSGVYAQTRLNPEEGEFLFLDLDCGGLCEAIEAVTQGVNNQDFSHLGIIHWKNDSVFVLEAMGNSVRLTPLKNFLSYTRKPALRARVKPKFKHLIPEAIQFGLNQIGKQYDDAFLPENDKYYCSELVYDAFKEANGKKEFFALEPMTFRQPGNQKFFPVWVEYYQKLGIAIPEAVPGCNPGGLSRSEKLEILGNFTWP
jgi:hypothetical protein